MSDQPTGSPGSPGLHGSTGTAGTGDVLSRLAEDARRLRVARQLPGKGPIPWQKVHAVQQDFERFITDTGMSLQQIARRMGAGCSVTVLSAFRHLRSDDDHVGDRDRVVRAVNQFMEDHARAREVPRPDGWVETDVALRMLTLIQNTIAMRSIGMIYSDAGRGKTMTMRAAADIYSGSTYLRVRATTRTVPGLARQIAEALRLPGKRGTTRMIQERIVTALRDTGRALLVDEAHQLTPPAFEFLRDLHDECGIPIVLAGTHELHTKTADNNLFLGQFNSRVALHYDVTEGIRETDDKRPLHSKAEIRALFERGQVRLTDDGAAFGAKMANLLGFGGLRLVEKVIFAASRIAVDGPLDANLLMRVLRQMHGHVLASDCMKTLEESKVQVA
jgi:DNA transposition AAA+ family ATPase